jgi:hypothetical protein
MALRVKHFRCRGNLLDRRFFAGNDSQQAYASTNLRKTLNTTRRKDRSALEKWLSISNPPIPRHI